VLGGTAHGRLLKVPRGLALRPASARIKQALFSHLGERLRDARVLDLYAGTGAYGIEALSRGAKEATFVELHPRAVQCIRENLAALGFSGRATVVRADVLRFLQHDDQTYHLIFAGPPYQKERLRLENPPMPRAVLPRLAPGGLFVWEFCRWNTVILPESWEPLWERVFGETRLWVLAVRQTKESPGREGP
jgi:16S rRNA (guanine966-N2)-methyltransferase